MAVMSNADRQAASTKFQADISAIHETIVGCTKNDITAAVAALDDYFNTNAAAINNALPAAAKAGLTITQKARLLTTVVYQRYIVGA